MNALSIVVVATAAFCSLLCASCSSPNELDTPRKTTYGSVPPARPVITAVGLSIDGGPTGIPFTCTISEAELDTNGGLWLWLRGECSVDASVDPADLPLRRINLRIDSLDLTGGGIHVRGDEGSGRGTSLVYYSMLFGEERSFTPDDAATQLVFDAVRYDRAERTITASLRLLASPDGRPLQLNGTLTLHHQ